MKQLTQDQILSILFKRFPTSGKVYKEDNESSRLFILRYWIEEVDSGKGKSERYKLLGENSFIRKEIEFILKSHVIDERYVRFHEESSVWDNASQHVYVGLRLKN